MSAALVYHAGNPSSFSTFMMVDLRYSDWYFSFVKQSIFLLCLIQVRTEEQYRSVYEVVGHMIALDKSRRKSSRLASIRESVFNK